MASQPMDDKRSHTRFAVALDVKVEFDSHSCILKTRDISDGGVLLTVNDIAEELPPLGTRVTLQVQTPLLDDEPAPIVHGEVVRFTDDAIGVAFIEDE